MLGVFAGGAVALQAAPPSSPQGIVTANTYPGNVRPAIIAGEKPASDGTHYPGIAELPYNGYPGPYSGDPATPPPGDVRNNYTMHLRFYYHAPKAGKLQFAIASDDPGNLFVATDANPANKVQVAVEPQWNAVRSFGGGDPAAPTRRTVTDDGKEPSPRPGNMSQFFTVTAGQVLYVEAVANEGGGGDNLAVAARYSTDPEFADGDQPISANISSVDRADVTKAAITGLGSTPVGFSVNVINGSGNNGTKLDKASVKVELDGAAVATTVEDTADGSRIVYSHATVFASGSKHTVKVSAKDTGGASLQSTADFTVSKYGLLSKDLKVPDSAVKKNEPGFLYRTFQNSADTRNTNAKSEEAIAGTLKNADGPLPNQADPNAQGNAKGPGKKLGSADNALIEFEIETVINLDQGGGSNGAFTPDEQMPGIPGIEGSTDGIVAEIITFIEFPRGLITMGVNSDDGFKTTAGLNPADSATAVLLGEFNGGRGASDTIFQFVVEEAGIYQIRTTWEEGGGGANIEWFTVNAGTKVLVNGEGGLKAYRRADIVVPAALVARSPAPNATGQEPRPDIVVAWNDPGGAIDQASIKMKVDGKDASVTLAKAGNTVTATHKPSADFGFSKTVKVDLSFKNGGRDVTTSWSFFVKIDMSAPGTLFIETEDFDFDGGQTITDQPIGMTGKYPGGSFRDKGDGLDNAPGNKSFGVDYFETSAGNAQAIYRPQTGVEAGKEDSQVTGGVSRGSFDVEKTFAVGWNDGGDWMNYTRTFPSPAKNYKIYGRISSGGAAINAELAQITAGQGTKDQTKKILGIFRPGRATSGWDGAGAFETFPLTAADGSGTPVIVELGGKTTLRFTTIDGNNDQDFLIFQPTTESPGGGVPTLAGKAEGGKLVITFTGTLQSSDNVEGPYADVAGATSPRTVDPTGAGKFYRAKGN